LGAVALGRGHHVLHDLAGLVASPLGARAGRRRRALDRDRALLAGDGVSGTRDIGGAHGQRQEEQGEFHASSGVFRPQNRSAYSSDGMGSTIIPAWARSCPASGPTLPASQQGVYSVGGMTYVSGFRRGLGVAAGIVASLLLLLLSASPASAQEESTSG